MQAFRKTVLAASVFLFSSAVFAQMTMPEMPAISDGPSMPVISAPTFGGKFYTPGIITNPRTNFPSTVKTSDEKKENKTAAQESSSSVKKSVLPSLNQSILTASNISSLGNSGLLSGIYGLLGADETSGSIQDLYPSTKTGDDAMLTSILSALEDLKTEQKKLSENQQASVEEKKAAPERPAILRFSVNGYNILETCKTVYFSNRENDGSFLLTGDRKYLSENKMRDETFYLLFRADGNCGSSLGYNVQPSVVQDYTNPLSFLYQLSSQKDLKAEKTGNLVSLRVDKPDWKMDLLLDIGE